MPEYEYDADNRMRFTLELYAHLRLSKGLEQEIAKDIAWSWFAKKMSQRWVLNLLDNPTGRFGPGF